LRDIENLSIKKPYEYWYNTFGLTQKDIEVFLDKSKEEQNG